MRFQYLAKTGRRVGHVDHSAHTKVRKLHEAEVRARATRAAQRPTKESVLTALRQRFREHANARGRNARKVVKSLAGENNNTISLRQFAKASVLLGVDLSKKEAKILFDLCKPNNRGEVSFGYALS